MEPLARQEITELLHRMAAGDRSAENQLYELVMPDLRRLAQHLLGSERPDHTLQGTELVHRMYLRLTGSELSLRDRGHFFAIAARAMRRELIDHARGRPAFSLIPLDALPENLFGRRNDHDVALAVDELLDQLRESMPLECSIVEMKVFLGMTDEECAASLNLPIRTLQAKWQDARIWLFEKAEEQQWKPRRSRPTPSKAATNAG